MKQKILILGATGMAGHLAYYYLKETGRYELSNLVFRERLTEESIIADVTNVPVLTDVLAAQRPAVIVNCVGVLIKGSSQDPANAILVNGWLPHSLKKAADNIGARLLHISTDCVFSGKKGAYSEVDFRDADDTYGRSKALGELVNDKDLTLRTSIIGPELKQQGEGLFHWFMQQRGPVNGYTTAYWGGITTLQLAKAIDAAIMHDINGLVHVTNGQRISKYELLQLFAEIFGRSSTTVNPFEGKSVDKSLVPSTKFDFRVPSYKDMLVEQKEWMDAHRELYKKIYA